MSMNLHCSGIELRQTPTQITYMCLVQPDGTIPSEVKGRKALHAIQIYKQWIAYCRDRIVFKDKDELSEWLEMDKQHLQAVDQAIKTSKPFKVWLL